jgi:hypothetical protein
MENSQTRYEKYGIPLEERRVHKGLLKELFHMSKKVNKSTTLYANVGDNKELAFVFIPTSKGYNRLKKNENKHKWFGHLLTALGEDGNKQDTVGDLFIHVGRKEEYKEAIVEAIKMNGDRVIPQLDPVATYAIQSACNMNAAQFKTLQRCAFSEFGFQFCSLRRIESNKRLAWNMWNQLTVSTNMEAKRFSDVQKYSRNRLLVSDYTTT